jgi:hypothetical protein
MATTRRGALMAAAAGLTAATAGLAGADDVPIPAVEPRKLPEIDPVLSHMPVKLVKLVTDTFPRHRGYRLGIRKEKEKDKEGKEKEVTVYRVRVFDPFSPSAQGKAEGDESVITPVVYELELTEGGKIVEELPHPVFDQNQLPQAVVDRYAKWNPRGVKGMAVKWYTELPKGKERVYRVRVLVNAITAYDAAFKPDGSVISAKPETIP